MRLHVGGSYRNVLKQTLVGFAESLDDWATGAVGTKRLPTFAILKQPLRPVSPTEFLNGRQVVTKAGE